MESQKVDMYMMANAKFFQPSQINFIRERPLAADDSKWAMINSADLKDPSTILIVSILAGTLGIDRFIIGDTGIGVGKLLTAGGCGIWAIVDWFLIQDATRQKNLEKIQLYL